jgi:hypothetical protein
MIENIPAILDRNAELLNIKAYTDEYEGENMSAQRVAIIWMVVVGASLGAKILTMRISPGNGGEHFVPGGWPLCGWSYRLDHSTMANR